MADAKFTRRGIWRLQPGEPLPSGDPSRYVTPHGYVVLRWLVAPACYVEIFEHRLVCGRPPAGLEVHHINGVKTDNRRENLQVITPSKHGQLAVTFDVEKAIEAYRSGMSYPAIGRMLGVCHVGVMRAMKHRGHVSRPSPKDKTHCKHGHPFDEKNTYVWRGSRRHCKTCNRDRMRNYLRAKRSASVTR